jgi:hypothetical protein
MPNKWVRDEGRFERLLVCRFDGGGLLAVGIDDTRFMNGISTSRAGVLHP